MDNSQIYVAQISLVKQQTDAVLCQPGYSVYNGLSDPTQMVKDR